ncbi:hypothetical protein KAU11_07345 [Candidatus Babeliales bacterium]|nr:hypothetical protein [Candidatus Babeliales bacterium]
MSELKVGNSYIRTGAGNLNSDLWDEIVGTIVTITNIDDDYIHFEPGAPCYQYSPWYFEENFTPDNKIYLGGE